MVTDRSGRVVHFNRACEELTGYRRDEVLGDIVLDRFVPAGWRPVVAARFADLHAPELREPHENPWLTRAGDERLIEWRCLALPQPDENSLWFLVGFGIDITERKRAEMALRESEGFARSVLDGLSAHIAIVGVDGAIQAVNAAWSKFATANGVNPRDLQVGANYLSVCDRSVGQYSEEAPLIAASIRAVLDKQMTEYAIEYRHLKPVDRGPRRRTGSADHAQPCRAYPCDFGHRAGEAGRNPGNMCPGKEEP